MADDAKNLACYFSIWLTTHYPYGTKENDLGRWFLRDIHTPWDITGPEDLKQMNKWQRQLFVKWRMLGEP